MKAVDVAPRMRRVTLGGEQLGAFRKNGRDLPAFRTAAPDDHVKVFLAVPGHEPVLPLQADDHLDWPSDPRPIDREYTVRRFDPIAYELSLDILVRGEGMDGPGARWAADAQPGDVLHIGGPRASHLPPSKVSEVHLIGDLTARPAIDRWLEAPPVERPAHVTLLVSGDEAWDPVGAASVRRLDLSDEVPELATLPQPAASAYVWVAGEGSHVSAIRTHLLSHGVPRSAISASAYWWRAGTGDH